ncbi:MAG: prepilin-type N-terminal cleavage/methylation domain-containing protein [Pirellulaceae bacterium]
MTTALPTTARTTHAGPGSRDRHAFTLLEVMLAVMLAAFVVAGIAAATHLHLKVLVQQQVMIERSQIARNILVMIKSDLRAAVQYKPSDVTGLDALTVSQAAIAGIAMGADMSETDLSQVDTGSMDTGGIDPGAIDPGAAAAASGGGTPSSSGSSSGQSSSPDETGESEPAGAPQDISSGNTPILRPGIYGTQTELMIDISRLPRIDQYDPVATGAVPGEGFNLPTDIKTVAYFLSGESLESMTTAVGIELGAKGGLYRRQLDRAVAAYSADTAGALAALGNTKLIAHEVVAIEFRYFDGEDWRTEWNSESEGGFPAAIEVTIVVNNKRSISDDVEYSVGSGQVEGQAYRTVVNLPMAEILSEEELQMMAEQGGSQ